MASITLTQPAQEQIRTTSAKNVLKDTTIAISTITAICGTSAIASHCNLIPITFIATHLPLSAAIVITATTLTLIGFHIYTRKTNISTNAPTQNNTSINEPLSSIDTVQTEKIKKTRPVRIQGLFIVSKVSKDEWPTISNIANEWSALGLEKYKQIHGGKLFSPKTRNEASSDPGKLIKYSLSMCEDVSNTIREPTYASQEGEVWDTIFTCSLGGEIQAIALHDKKNNKLGYVVTHPNNINHEINQDCQQVKGAGTQIMLHLLSKTLHSNSVLKLRAVEEAKPFYEKMHFEYAPEDNRAYDGYEGITSMKLSADKIKNLIAAGTTPFNQL